MTFLVDGTLGGTFPSWTTATRPASPAVGQMGYNTTTGLFDNYTAAGWVSGLTSASQSIPFASLPTGSVLQVVQATVQTENATQSTSFTSTGLAVSITPKYSTSKILILVNGASFGVSAAAEGYWTVDRSGTNIGNGTGGFGRIWNNSATSYTFAPSVIIYLDSPATTSALTYTVQYRQTNAAQFVYISGGGGKSSIIVMEIAG